MNFFSTISSASSQYLSAPIRKRSQNLKPRDDLDEFLSSDLELSFASTMSLNSPSRDYVNITQDTTQDDAMDISPMPSHVSRKEPVHFSKPTTRPRAYTSGARMFGQDLSNNSISNNSISDSMLGTQSGSKPTQRTALPVEWFSAKPLERTQTSDDNLFAPVCVHTPILPVRVFNSHFPAR
jgi:M-phase inducer tyrosine phosphatase